MINLYSCFWKTLSSKYVYENPWLKVRHDEVMKPDGTKGIYGVIEGRNYNMIIPKIGNQFFLVEQFRYTTSRMSIEFPGGAIEPNETIDAAAARELHEETGLLGGRLTHLGFLHEGNGHENFGCGVKGVGTVCGGDCPCQNHCLERAGGIV